MTRLLRLAGDILDIARIVLAAGAALSVLASAAPAEIPLNIDTRPYANTICWEDMACWMVGDR